MRLSVLGTFAFRDKTAERQTTMDAIGNGIVVRAFGSVMQSTTDGLNSIPGDLGSILRYECWREFITERGKQVYHDRLFDFVIESPPRGLGSNVETIRQILIHADDKETLELLDQALQKSE